MSETPEEFVYLIASPGNWTVKIGRSRNPERRLAAIQTMSPVRLGLLWVHPGDSELEAYLHRAFAGIRSHGEWFTFESDPIAAVEQAVVARQGELEREAARRRSAGPLDPRLLTAVAHASAEHLQARKELEEVIREARRDGLSLTLISEHTGFSREWVRKIADGKSYKQFA